MLPFLISVFTFGVGALGGAWLSRRRQDVLRRAEWPPDLGVEESHREIRLSHAADPGGETAAAERARRYSHQEES
jgi:hypothetical protein